MRKLRVGIVFGGTSAEHEVSLQSAKNVINALDKNKYEPVLIGIDKEGRWHLQQESNYLLNSENPKLIRLNNSSDPVALIPSLQGGQLVDLQKRAFMADLDVIFPVLHGPHGEDGTIQGLLRLANIPFVGSGILGSAVCMDKDFMKRLLRDAGMPIPKFMSLSRAEILHIDYQSIIEKVGEPFFIKPANLGSSVGISKVHSREEFKLAVAEALRFDNKVILEETINGREIECAVLGNHEPQASIPGEVIPHHEFYSYEAKYIDENGASFEVPAKLPVSVMKEIQEYAVKAFLSLNCAGMARVDFFVTAQNKIYINELNTIPGFTQISMYPRLWNASGIGYTELIDRLIQLAREKFDEEQSLEKSNISIT